MHRFFVSPSVLERRPVVLDGEQAHHIRRVLRMRPGERATLLDNHGGAYEASLLSYGDSEARFEIVRRWTATGEPRTQVTLYHAILKGERFAWALQKCTEVGVSRFVPIVSERSVVNDLRTADEKRARWDRIIREAAEQSGRGRLPVLESALTFERAIRLGSPPLSAPGPLRLILWEEESDITLREALAGCNFAGGARIEVLVGPEGGFTVDEVNRAERCAVRRVSLGPRILRAETAGVVAAAAILFAAGDI